MLGNLGGVCFAPASISSNQRGCTVSILVTLDPGLGRPRKLAACLRASLSCSISLDEFYHWRSLPVLFDLTSLDCGGGEELVECLFSLAVLWVTWGLALRDAVGQVFISERRRGALLGSFNASFLFPNPTPARQKQAEAWNSSCVGYDHLNYYEVGSGPRGWGWEARKSDAVVEAGSSLPGAP